MRYLILFFTLLMVGCGPPRVAQQSLTAAAVALDAVDEDTASIYRLKGEECRVENPDWDTFDSCMEPVYRVETAVRMSDRFLRAAQRAVNAWSEGGEEDWPGLAACARDALHNLLQGLEELEGVVAPALLRDALNLWRTFGGRCEVPSG